MVIMSGDRFEIYEDGNNRTVMAIKSGKDEARIYLPDNRKIPLALQFLGRCKGVEIIKSHNDRVQEFSIPADSTVIIIRKEEA